MSPRPSILAPRTLQLLLFLFCCTFTLQQTTNQQKIYLVADGSLSTQFLQDNNGSSSIVVNLYVPQKPNTSRIVLNIEANVPQDASNTSISLYMNKGNQIPSIHQSDENLSNGIFATRTLLITRDSSLFCLDCNYTLVIETVNSQAVKIQASCITDLADVWQKNYLDAAEMNGFNVYSLTVPWKPMIQDIILYINPHQGSPKVFINCDVVPTNQSGYKWEYDISIAQDIVLTIEELDLCQTQSLYVLVQSTNTSIYSIGAHVNSTRIINLRENLVVTGNIQPGQQLIEKFILPLKRADKLTFELDTNSNINISISNCRDFGDCPNLGFNGAVQNAFDFDWNTKLYIESNIPPFEYNITQIENKKQIAIDTYKNCVPFQWLPVIGFSETLCVYIVTLTSRDAKQATFNLKSNVLGHEQLLAAIPKFDIVQEDQFNYYVLEIPHSNVESITFQLNVLLGDAVLYASKTDEYPSQYSNSNSTSNSEVVFQGTGINGTYFVGVKGYQRTSFMLNTTVITFDGKAQDYAVELQKGISIQGLLKPRQGVVALYYKYYLENPKDKVQWSLNFMLSQYTTHLGFCVNNVEGAIPNLDQYSGLANSDSGLRIHSIEDYFRPTGWYYFGVFLMWDGPNVYLQDEFSFTAILKRTFEAPATLYYE